LLVDGPLGLGRFRCAVRLDPLGTPGCLLPAFPPMGPPGLPPLPCWPPWRPPFPPDFPPCPPCLAPPPPFLLPVVPDPGCLAPFDLAGWPCPEPFLLFFVLGLPAGRFRMHSKSSSSHLVAEPGLFLVPAAFFLFAVAGWPDPAPRLLFFVLWEPVPVDPAGRLFPGPLVPPVEACACLASVNACFRRSKRNRHLTSPTAHLPRGTGSLFPAGFCPACALLCCSRAFMVSLYCSLSLIMFNRHFTSSTGQPLASAVTFAPEPCFL